MRLVEQPRVGRRLTNRFRHKVSFLSWTSRTRLFLFIHPVLPPPLASSRVPAQRDSLRYATRLQFPIWSGPICIRPSLPLLQLRQRHGCLLMIESVEWIAPATVRPKPDSHYSIRNSRVSLTTRDSMLRDPRINWIHVCTCFHVFAHVCKRLHIFDRWFVSRPIRNGI